MNILHYSENQVCVFNLDQYVPGDSIKMWWLEGAIVKEEEKSWKNNDRSRIQLLSFEKKGDDWLRPSRDMLILLKWLKNISVLLHGMIVKYADPQINSVPRQKCF